MDMYVHAKIDKIFYPQREIQRKLHKKLNGGCRTPVT
jgi:hypothetical protein